MSAEIWRSIARKALLRKVRLRKQRKRRLCRQSKAGTLTRKCFEEPDETFRISEEEADRIEEKMRDGEVKVDTETVCVNVAGE